MRRILTLSIYTDFIKRRGSAVKVNGVDTKAIISAMGRSLSDQRVQFKRAGRFIPGEAKCGDLITEGSVSYLVLAAQDQRESTYAHLGICNATVDIKYWYEEQDEYGTPILAEWRTRASTQAHQTFISARMREEDPGLLATTVCTFHIPASIACQLLDRIVLGSTKYQVNAIDDISSPGLKVLQVSTDERP
jgi:hypothetical protein